jgi:hypothetical protein
LQILSSVAAIKMRGVLHDDLDFYGVNAYENSQRHRNGYFS